MTAAVESIEAAFDGFEPGDYDARLYEQHGVIEGIDGRQPITAAHLERYRRDGFLAVEGMLAPDEVASALDGMLDLIDGKRPDYRFIQFEAAAKPFLKSLTAEEKQDYVRKISSFVRYDARLAAVAAHPRILEVARRILGEEPALFEDKALIKPPRIGREKPWHQDHAYWNLPLDAPVVTVWIALDAATLENGCMYLIPGSQREGAVVHFKRRDWQICDRDVNVGRVVAAPLAPGGCLFFDSYVQHGTPANRSDQRRRALQFVYVPASAARISTAERLAVFGSEGKDVTC